MLDISNAETAVSGFIENDYFDTLGEWRASPDLAFAAWMQAQGYRDSTLAVYQVMWKHLLAWLDQRGVPFTDISFEQVRAFLDENHLYKAHRQRYVRILERAFNHLAVLGFAGANPGRKAAKEGVGAGDNDDTRFLTDAERSAVIAALVTTPERISAARTNKDAWFAMRDQALVGAMLGAGLKVGQVRTVSVSCLGFDPAFGAQAFIDLPPRRGVDRAHRAMVLPFAQAVLEGWRELTADRAAPTAYLFPAERERGGRRPQKADAPIHAASVFRRVQAFLGDCGIAGERACAQTLRNTYAAILIDAGVTDVDLAERMGLGVGRTIDRLRTSYAKAQANSIRAALRTG